MNDAEADLEQLKHRLNDLSNEHDRLLPAARYVDQLFDLIAEHPMLQSEWDLFLRRAGLPDFKRKD